MLALLCAALFASQAANAFFCFKSASSNRSFGRPAPYLGSGYGPPPHLLPSIMPGRGAVRHQPLPRRAPPPVQWRPVKYRSGS